jgi:hypothetical protein
MRMVKVRYERFKPGDDLKAALDRATATQKEKAEVLAAAEKELIRVESAVAELKKASDAIDPKDLKSAEKDAAYARVAAKLAKGEFEAAKKAAETAQSALDEAARIVDACGYIDRFTASLTPYVADASKRYIAKLDHRASRTDNLIVTTTRAGLLSTARGSADDQTSAIIASLASAVGARSGNFRVVNTGQDTLPVTLTNDQKTKICNAARRRDFEMTIDPKKPHLDDLNAYVKNQAQSFNTRACAALALPPASNCETKLGDYYEKRAELILDSGQTCTLDTMGTEGSGLLYRRETPVSIRIRIKDDNLVLASYQFEMPNCSPIDRVPMDASAFVKTDYTLGFENGMLVSYDARRPSEAAQIASLPFTVIKKLVEAPAELLQLKVDLTNKENSLVDAETDQLEKLLELLKAREALEAAQATDTQ